MYYVMRASAPSLHRESVDSLILLKHNDIIVTVFFMCIFGYKLHVYVDITFKCIFMHNIIKYADLMCYIK